MTGSSRPTSGRIAVRPRSFAVRGSSGMDRERRVAEHRLGPRRRDDRRPQGTPGTS